MCNYKCITIYLCVKNEGKKLQSGGDPCQLVVIRDG